MPVLPSQPVQAAFLPAQLEEKGTGGGGARWGFRAPRQSGEPWKEVLDQWSGAQAKTNCAVVERLWGEMMGWEEVAAVAGGLDMLWAQGDVERFGDGYPAAPRIVEVA